MYLIFSHAAEIRKTALFCEALFCDYTVRIIIIFTIFGLLYLFLHKVDELEKLEVAERRQRLIELVRKIDLDEDDDLEEDELAQWIKYVEMRQG